MAHGARDPVRAPSPRPLRPRPRRHRRLRGADRRARRPRAAACGLGAARAGPPPTAAPTSRSRTAAACGAGFPPGRSRCAGPTPCSPSPTRLVRLRMSGREIREVLEEAVDFLLSDPLSYSGSFPYAAGLRWSVDLGRPAGERFADLEVLIDGGWRPLEQDRLYRVVTNDFLAGGEDGYRGFARIPAERREALGLEYAEALIAFARARGELRRPAAEEMSTRRFRGPGP
ncbi:MAG: 5'-nucleotidase [Xanthomonadales bacterium]|nr:5'-nucleotidase [Xanthomonadales bacterium]